MHNRAALLLVVFALTGCSFGMPTSFPEKPARCRQNPGRPILDVIGVIGWGGLAVASGVTLADPDAREEGLTSFLIPVALLSGTLAVIQGIAAAHGFKANAACAAAQ